MLICILLISSSKNHQNAHMYLKKISGYLFGYPGRYPDIYSDIREDIRISRYISVILYPYLISKLYYSVLNPKIQICYGY
jgi:hypothetical protein